MNDEMNAAISEILATTGETYKGLAIAAGHIAGLFDIIKVDTPITVAEIAKRKDFDIDKLRRWVHFASGINIISVDDKEGVTLTTKGLLLSPASPVKDVLAFVDGFKYLIKSADQAENTFKKSESLDKLSDGKISKDYQPKVSDNFSMSLIDHIKKLDLSDSDTLFDVGCGNGSLLRALSKAFPNNHLSGIDQNLFAIEKAKKENISLGLQERIKMLVGDIIEDLDDFPDNSQEWVLAINVMHFVPPNKRDELIGNLARIARKGVFFNLCLADANMIALTANTMMSLMWNDFTGFYTAPEAKEFFDKLTKKYKNLDIRTDQMMQGTSSLVTMLKK